MHTKSGLRSPLLSPPLRVSTSRTLQGCPKQPPSETRGLPRISFPRSSVQCPQISLSGRRYLKLPDIPPTSLESISFYSVSVKPQKEEELCVQLVTLSTTIVPSLLSTRVIDGATQFYPRLPLLSAPRLRVETISATVTDSIPTPISS